MKGCNVELHRLPDNLVHIFGCFPFMLQSISEDGSKSVTLNWARLLEAVLIAVVGGALASYLSLRDMRTEFDLYKKSQVEAVERIEKQLEVIDERVYTHMIQQGGRK